MRSRPRECWSDQNDPCQGKLWNVQGSVTHPVIMLPYRRELIHLADRRRSSRLKSLERTGMSQFPETTATLSVVRESVGGARSATPESRSPTASCRCGKRVWSDRGGSQPGVTGWSSNPRYALRADGLFQPGQNRSITYPLHGGEALASAAPDPVRKAMHEYFLEPLDGQYQAGRRRRRW